MWSSLRSLASTKHNLLFLSALIFFASRIEDNSSEAFCPSRRPNNNNKFLCAAPSSIYDSDLNITSTIQWDVYICESKQCKERGSDKTFGAFVGLAPTSLVAIHPVIIQRPKGKGPNVRCIQRKKNSGKAFEVNNVDSVEKVHRILTKYMNVKGVDPVAYESLRWNYKGNSHLDKGEVALAIQCYDRALEAGYKDQEGVLLVMRATAYLQRAYNHRKELKVAVQALEESVPDPAALQMLFQISLLDPSLVNPIFTRVVSDFKIQNKKFQQTVFRHGLYEYALLHATQDSLHATQLLPRYAMTWMRAGDSLAELRKLKESVQYYEKALQLDPTLADTLRPTIARLKASQDVLDNARQDGYSEDALRVALDVLG